MKLYHRNVFGLSLHSQWSIIVLEDKSLTGTTCVTFLHNQTSAGYVTDVQAKIMLLESDERALETCPCSGLLVRDDSPPSLAAKTALVLTTEAVQHLSPVPGMAQRHAEVILLYPALPGVSPVLGMVRLHAGPSSYGQVIRMLDGVDACEEVVLVDVKGSK